MNPHNPANLPAETIGPNHKLLSTEDLDKPLPEGAEYWAISSRTWEPSADAQLGHIPGRTLTYRIPLSLSDRLRSERDRIMELIVVAAAVEKGAEWEHESEGDWHAPNDQSLGYLNGLIECGRKVRLKPVPPTPRSIPWTRETRPTDREVWVKNKDGTSDEFHVGRWANSGVQIYAYGFIPYETLHSDWLQRSGEPAGQEVQG